MSTTRQRIDSLLGRVLAGAMALAVLTVLWQVFSRYLLADPSSFTDELVRYLLIWISLLGASYAAGQQLHLAIDLLPRRLTGNRRYRLGQLIQGLIALFALLVMMVGGGHLVWITLSLDQRSAALGVPLGWVYSVVPLSGLLILYYSLDSALAARRRQRAEDGAEDGAEDE